MANNENKHLNNLREGVNATHDALAAYVEGQGESATVAERLMLRTAQRKREFLSQLAATDAPLTQAGLADQESSPHLTFDAQVTLDGKPVVNHEVDIEFFGHFLVHLQGVTNALAQARALVNANSGRFRESIVDGNQLRLASLSPGSVGVGLRVAPTKTAPTMDTPLPFDEALEEDNSHLPLDDLRLLLDGSSTNASLIDSLSNERVKTHYKKLIDLLVASEATLSYRTHSDSRPVTLGREQAIQRAFWLKAFSVDEKFEVITGILAGGSVERNRFELRLVGDESNSPLEGETTPHANKQMRALRFGDEVRAGLRVKIATNPEIGIEKRSYVLADISALSNAPISAEQLSA